MSGVAKEYLVRVDADPFCPQPPRDETSNGRGEHSDDNQVDTGTNSLLKNSERVSSCATIESKTTSF